MFYEKKDSLNLNICFGYSKNCIIFGFTDYFIDIALINETVLIQNLLTIK
jgi:hypothetical protein